MWQLGHFFKEFQCLKNFKILNFFQVIAKFVVLNPQCYFEVKIDNKSF